MRTRRAKHMRTDTDHRAGVRDPAIELLLNHTATLTDRRCSHPSAGRAAVQTALDTDVRRWERTMRRIPARFPRPRRSAHARLELRCGRGEVLVDSRNGS